MLRPVQTAISIPYEEVADFCEKYHIVRLWLFGSVLRADFHADSDIDVLVEFDPAHLPGWHIVSMQDELSSLLRREVQFSMPDALGKNVKFRIMQSARLIYERT